MQKIWATGKYIAGLLLLLSLLAACSTHAYKAATFNVETGDKITVQVDIKAGYDLTMEVPFVISKDETVILTGAFGQPEAYALYYQLIEDDPNASLLAEDTKDGNSYFFYTVDGSSGTEYNYIMQVDGAQTVIIMASLASQAEAEAAFAATTVSLAEPE